MSLEKLNAINIIAAKKASESLSQLIGQSVSLNLTRPEIKKIEELKPIVGPEEVVAAIHLPVTGDLKGATLLVFPKEDAFKLSDLLVRRAPGTTRKLSKLDESALKEVGNIISGNYITELANALQIKVIESIPSFSFDMFGAIVSQIVTQFARGASDGLVVKISFAFKPTMMIGYMILLFEVQHLEAVLGSLERA